MSNPINFGEFNLNVELIIQGLDKAERKLLGKTAKAAKACAEATKLLSLVYCPIDKGPLRASCKTIKTGPYHYQISYGDEIAWYAKIVHEVSHFRHNFPTRYQYLLQAVEDLSNGQSDTFDSIPSYQQIYDMVFRGEDVSGLLEFQASDEPIPD